MIPGTSLQGSTQAPAGSYVYSKSSKGAVVQASNPHVGQLPVTGGGSGGPDSPLAPLGLVGLLAVLAGSVVSKLFKR